MLTPREKNSFYQGLRWGLNLRWCITQDSEPKTLQTELFQPLLFHSPTHLTMQLLWKVRQQTSGDNPRRANNTSHLSNIARVEGLARQHGGQSLASTGIRWGTTQSKGDGSHIETSEENVQLTWRKWRIIIETKEFTQTVSCFYLTPAHWRNTSVCYLGTFCCAKNVFFWAVPTCTWQ